MTDSDLLLKQAFSLRENLYRTYQQSYSLRLLRLYNKATQRFVRRAESVGRKVNDENTSRT